MPRTSEFLSPALTSLPNSTFVYPTASVTSPPGCVIEILHELSKTALLTYLFPTPTPKTAPPAVLPISVHSNPIVPVAQAKTPEVILDCSRFSHLISRPSGNHVNSTSPYKQSEHFSPPPFLPLWPSRLHLLPRLPQKPPNGSASTLAPQWYSEFLVV